MIVVSKSGNVSLLFIICTFCCFHRKVLLATVSMAASQPIQPPIHLHIKTMRPKQCDIAWYPPIQPANNQRKLGYNIRVFKDVYEEHRAIHDYSICTTQWTISNLRPQTYYVIHIHTLAQTAVNHNSWSRSSQPSIIKFCTAPS